MGRKMFIAVNGLLIFSSLLFISAGKNGDKKTGFNLKAFEKSLCCIPKGSFMFEDSFEMSNDKINYRNVKVDSFYMCNHTVTNGEYRIFLEDLKTTNTQLYTQMLPDTLVWRNKLAFMEDMVKYYFRHPSYGDYPVVGVSHVQAEYYCKWLTERYMKEPKRKYKKAVFRLPSLYEWEWAAKGGLAISPFPWGGPYVRNFHGQFLANFRHTSETAVKRDGDTGKLVLTNPLRMTEFDNEAADITSPVISYLPNGYGLYCMAGNVNEYVAEPGIAKGGGWSDPGYYLQIWAEKPYKNAQSASNERGFRVAMEVRK